MNGEAIQADTLSALVSQHAIRETVVGRVVGIGRKQSIIAAAALPTASDDGLDLVIPRCSGGSAYKA